MAKVYEDVEMMVNEPNRQKAIRERYDKKEARKHRQMLINAVVFALIGILFAVLNAFGGLALWIAVPGCMASAVCATFNFGRWYEHGKCKGWKGWR